MQPFGPWSPDRFNVNSVFAGEALNVFPGAESYLPWPGLAAVATNAVPAAVRGAFAARTSSNGITYFVGTATKLYKFAGTTAAWTDVSRVSAVAYNLATDECWSFVQFGNTLYAFNGSDTPQSIDVNSGTNFAPATGSPPSAKFAAVVGGFIMVGNDANGSRRVDWCGREADTFWTIGQRDCDGQPFPDGGDVQGLTGIEVGGLIFQTECIRRMFTTQSRTIFEFHKIEQLQGTRSPYGIVPFMGGAFYYASNGFQATGPDGASQPIGSDWVNQWFLANSSVKTRPKALLGAIDPTRPRVIWLFASGSNPTSTPFDHAICYDPSLVGSNYGPWTHAAFPATYLFPAASPGWTLGDIGATYASLSLVPFPFGSDVWASGAPGLFAFGPDNKLANFAGAALAATVQTARFEAIPQKRCYVRGYRIITDAANVSGRVFTSERLQNPEVPGAPSSLDVTGALRTRASGRFIRIEATIPAGETWTAAQGVDFDENHIQPDGER